MADFHPQIIWINGPFGVGKSCLARNLADVIDHSYIFDPELVGKMLWAQIPKIWHEEEFEDEPVWRKTCLQLILDNYERYGKTMIVPMTIVKDVSYEEIFKPLQTSNVKFSHYCLMASPDTISRRLLGRGEISNSWEEQQIARCLTLLADQKFSKHIDTTDMLERQVAKKVYAMIQSAD